MPMNKANLKNILTAVRDMINRSRIAYKDYLGEETVTETKVLVEGNLSETYSPLTLKDPSYIGFVAGEGYEVTIDGATQTLTAISDSGVGVITNAIDLDHPGENYFIVDFLDNQVMGEAGGTYIGKTISISQTKTTTTKKYDIKKVPQELIPDTIARSVDVANVKTKADDAFYQANTAQTTADNARATADQLQASVNEVLYKSVSFEFDQQTEGRDNFTYNSYKYYKISDFSPDATEVVAFYGTRASGSANSSYERGTNCDKYGLFIVVTAAGSCSLTNGSFESPPTGLYACHEPGNLNMTAGVGKFILSAKYSSVDVNAQPLISNIKYIEIKSSTAGSTKKFRITVDDTGALSATEVTE